MKSCAMEAEHSFYSFKLEMKNLISQWKSLSSKPCEHMGQKLSVFQTKHEIGKVTITELFSFEPKFIYGKDQHLYMYYIDHEDEQFERIIKYDCSTQVKSYLYTSKYTILSITVA